MKKLSLGLLMVLLLCSSAFCAAQSEWERLNQEADSLYQKAWYAKGIEVAKKALVAAQKEKSDLHAASSLFSLGRLYCESTHGTAHGNNAKLAESCYRRALALYEKRLGRDAVPVANCLNQLANLNIDNRGFSEPLLKRALAIRQKALGPDHPEVAETLSSLAKSQEGNGRREQAEQLYRRALAIREKALGPDHPEVAKSLDDLGTFYAFNPEKKSEQYAQGQELLQRSVRIREKEVTPAYPDVGVSLSLLAAAYSWQSAATRDQDLLEKARATDQRALEARERIFGPDHPLVADSLDRLAQYLRDANAPALAEPFYRRALAIREKASAPDDVFIRSSLEELARVCYAQGRAAEARDLYRRSLAIAEKKIGARSTSASITRQLMEETRTPYVVPNFVFEAAR